MREVESSNFRWLLKLRWGAIAAQLIVFLAGDRLMHVSLPILPMALIVLLALGTNVACTIWARRAKAVPEWTLFGLMALDCVLLTTLLYLTGGDSNPFAVLYLVNIALAGVLLQPRWTWALTALSVLCVGSLFFGRAIAPPPSQGSAEDPLDWQMRELWLAFAVASALLVYFIQRTVRMLREREHAAEVARQTADRREKLASLATLAAGAAHELATPLSTIALTAKELERQLERHGNVADAIADARLIRQEVERCRNILSQMAADAGQSRGEPIESIRIATLLDRALSEISDRHRIQIDVADNSDARVTVPPRAFAQGIKAVLRNALQASAADGSVWVRIVDGEQTWLIEVSDRGRGMTPDVLSHAGEPFFTTKEPGHGLGLGLFLTRSLLEQLGGGLELSSLTPAGTRVVLILPKPGMSSPSQTPVPAEALSTGA